MPVTFGGEGKGESRFRSPHGIAIDKQCLLHVADMLNHRIQARDSTVLPWLSAFRACLFVLVDCILSQGDGIPFLVHCISFLAEFILFLVECVLFQFVCLLYHMVAYIPFLVVCCIFAHG